MLAQAGLTVRYGSGRVVAAMSAGYAGEGKTDAKDAYVIAETARLRRSLTGFVAAVVFVTARAASGSIRHAIAVAGVQGGDRTQLRANMHTVLNAGFGCGTVLGVAVLASATDKMFTAAYALGAVFSLITAGATLRLPTPTLSAQLPRTLGT